MEEIKYVVVEAIPPSGQTKLEILRELAEELELEILGFSDTDDLVL